MENVTTQTPNSTYRQIEFYLFCVISFAAKSMLLIALPYREWPVNTVYTCSLLLFFYCYFRFRQGLRAPFFVLFSLAAAVAVDILGNKFGLYGHPFGPLRDYDEFAHFAGSGFSAIAAFWVLRAGTLRMGFKLSNGLLGFLATSVAFTYCGWYEILELWDELFYSHFERIHWWYDSANDLFYDFLGVIVFIAAAALFFAVKERTARQPDNKLRRVRMANLFSTLPRDLLAFFVTTAAFGLCAWFEIFRMFDQQWFGRIHLVGNRDTAIYLEWELAASVLVGVISVALSKLAPTRKASAA
ncbi:MAG: hypothetical protein AABN33_23265 [Acidobacteriota bacterium]